MYVLNFTGDYKRAREKLEASQFTSSLDTEVEDQGPSGRPQRKRKYVFLFLPLVANSNGQIHCGIIYVHCKYFLLSDLNMLAHI